jgi:phage terminase Nu1 subunit (DNA packaging protein)
MNYEASGSEEYGKFLVQKTESDIPGSWVFSYGDGLIVGNYDGITKYDPLNPPKVDMQKAINQKTLQRLYTWKDFLEDRKMFFDRSLRKAKIFELFFDLYTLEAYCYQAVQYIECDVNSIDFDIEYNNIKDTLSGVPYSANLNLKKPIFYTFEQLQIKVASLIKHFEENDNSQTNSEIFQETVSAIQQPAKRNPRAITDDPADLREIWFKNGFPISKERKNGEYEIYKIRAFIQRLYQENYIFEDGKPGEGKDAVSAEWIMENIHVHGTLETIKRAIRDCKSPKTGKSG